MDTRPDFAPVATFAPTLAASPTHPRAARSLRLLIALGVAMVVADIIARVVWADVPLHGPLGLLALYGETAAVAVGLAFLRVVRPSRGAIASTEARRLAPHDVRTTPRDWHEYAA